MIIFSKSKYFYKDYHQTSIYPSLNRILATSELMFDIHFISCMCGDRMNIFENITNRTLIQILGVKLT